MPKMSIAEREFIHEFSDQLLDEDYDPIEGSVVEWYDDDDWEYDGGQE